MKFMENLKKKKANNKGFSLVELIIVIAIMAILVGIVGTQVVPYLERSRVAKDQQVLSGLCTDGMTAFSTNGAKIDSTKTYTITISGSKTEITYTTGATGSTNVMDTFLELHGAAVAGADSVTTFTLSDLKLESKAGKDLKQVDIVFDGKIVKVKPISNTSGNNDATTGADKTLGLIESK